MRKSLIWIPILLLAALALAGCGASAETLNNQGNEAFAEQDFDDALLAYQQAAEKAPEMAEPHYNAANAHYRQADYPGAQQEIEAALVGEEQLANLDQESYYNLGNTFYQAQQYQAAIEAYQEALRLNPDDLQAKQNLELALRQLQQQEQEQQNQEQQDQESGNQDQQQDEQNQDQQQDDQQGEQNQDQQQGDQQDEQNQDQQQGDQQDEQGQQGQGEGLPDEVTGLTEEQARQLLQAAAQDTESLEEFLQQILTVPGPPPTEDW